MRDKLKILDVVALIEQIPDKNLKKGQVGTIVEILDENNYELEFSDNNGKTFLTTSVAADKLILLHFTPETGSKNPYYPK